MAPRPRYRPVYANRKPNLVARGDRFSTLDGESYTVMGWDDLSAKPYIILRAQDGSLRIANNHELGCAFILWYLTKP